MVVDAVVVLDVFRVLAGEPVGGFVEREVEMPAPPLRPKQCSPVRAGRPASRAMDEQKCPAATTVRGGIPITIMADIVEE